MILLTVEQITKSYGDKLLFEEITLGISSGEKIGLMGINGTGKSTLLRIMAGLETPDQGEVITSNNARIGYLPQEPEFDTDATILEQVFLGRPPTGEEWEVESEAKTILNKLGISDFQARVGTLSGGLRKRVALAAALLTPADLLILDEPTNQLDVQAIDWLEQYLNRRKGALVMVTHDRYFLDRVVNQVVELDHGDLYSYSGNYSGYLELKAGRQEKLQASEDKRQAILRKELLWIRRGARARSTKQKARIERFNDLQQSGMEQPERQVDISAVSSRLGKKVVELDHLCHSYGERPVIHDFSFRFQRGERVGVIGPNGVGKTTLLQIIAGRLVPDSGKLELGSTVKMGYFTQENTEPSGDLKVIDSVREVAEYLPTADGGVISASQMLERFLFPSQLQWMPISTLSGGEKRRLNLLLILMGAPNLLLLDEPTNDLDIQTLMILEDYLDDFAGTVIAVSHDRYFLDRIAGKIFSFEGDGVIREYPGNYSDYLDFHQVEIRPEHAETRKERRPVRPQRQLKFSFQEQQEYEQLDFQIAALEQQLQALGEQINASASDYLKLQGLIKQQQNLQRQLDERMERWVFLNDLAEEIEKARQGK